MQKPTRQLFLELRDESLIRRCVQYGQWTVPAVFPDLTNGVKQREVLYDYQSIGAMLAHSLATKLTQLLFPTNTSFFKLSFENVDNLSKEEKEALGRLELGTVSRLFENASYAKLVQALLLLVITGNALLVRKDGAFQVHNLHSYVVRRDHRGKPTCIILRERIRTGDLPTDIRGKLNAQDPMGDDVYLELYTRCELRSVNGVMFWEEWQDIDNVEVSAQRGRYPENLCPYIPVTWQLYTGEQYGRGHVELYAGDFIRLSELSAALGTYELESCNIKYLYDPQSYTDVDYLTNASIGAVVQGNPNSISALEAGQFQKIQVLGTSIQSLFQRLAQAFMYGVNQREGERVTAYEIHVAAQQAEQSLGGVYSQLSHALHLPLAYLLSWEVDPSLGVPIAEGGLQVNVITGIPALSRSADLQQWMMLGQELGNLVPVLQQVSPRFNTEAIVDVFMQAHGLSSTNVMFTGEELQARLEQLQAQQEAAQHQIRNIQSTDATVEATEQLGAQLG